MFSAFVELKCVTTAVQLCSCTKHECLNHTVVQAKVFTLYKVSRSPHRAHCIDL